MHDEGSRMRPQERAPGSLTRVLSLDPLEDLAHHLDIVFHLPVQQIRGRVGEEPQVPSLCCDSCCQPGSQTSTLVKKAEAQVGQA